MSGGYKFSGDLGESNFGEFDGRKMLNTVQADPGQKYEIFSYLENN
jgi:hypothetical protein